MALSVKIEIAYTRLVIVFTAYISGMLYEVMSGYLRGFGISLVPAILIFIALIAYRPSRRYASLSR